MRQLRSLTQTSLVLRNGEVEQKHLAKAKCLKDEVQESERMNYIRLLITIFLLFVIQSVMIFNGFGMLTLEYWVVFLSAFGLRIIE